MTVNNPFVTPAAASGGIDWNPLNGTLVIIKVTAFETGIQTSNGPRDAARADVYPIDGPQAGDKHEDTLIFPKVMASQLRPRVGQLVIGRVGQGIAKSGQNAPWILQDPTQADIQAGVVAWQKIQAGQFQTPAPQAQPQTQPVQQAPTQTGQPAQQTPTWGATPQQGGLPF